MQAYITVFSEEINLILFEISAVCRWFIQTQPQYIMQPQ